MGSDCAQRILLVMLTRGFARADDGRFHGNTAICRMSPVKTSATKSHPRVSSDSVTRTRASGCVPVISKPTLCNSLCNKLRKLDHSPAGNGVRFCISSETIGWRGSRDDVRAASCAAASIMLCAGNSSAEPNNRTAVTRIIDYIMGHINLLACHQSQQKSQTDERQKQCAPEAESQPQHRFRKVAEDAQEHHCKPPEMLTSADAAIACRCSGATSSKRLASSGVGSAIKSTSSPTWTSSNNSSAS